MVKMAALNVNNALLQQLILSVNQSRPSVAQTPAPVYSYRVRIISPTKKSDVIVRQLHRVTSKFTSVGALKTALSDELQSHVSNKSNFNIGYMEGNRKIWLVNSDDLKSMYEKYKQGGQIVLWCDGRPEDEASSFALSGKRKRDNERSTRRQEQEDQVEKAFERLKDKHGDDEFDIPRLRLWSRMICSGLHDDYNVPPKIPAFSIGSSKNHQQRHRSKLLPHQARLLI